MNLSDVKLHLQNLKEISILLPSGVRVPAHFHITEVGLVHKHFIDCGGTVRTEKKASFQLYLADDFDHRLSPQKLINIIEMSQRALQLEDLEVEVEFQGHTIEKYGMEAREGGFMLSPMFTDCLAKDKCGIPEPKAKVSLGESIQSSANACKPGSGCC